MDKVKLSKTTVANAQPRDREYHLWDNRLAGFGLRVRTNGRKSFIFLYRGPGGRQGVARRITLKSGHPDHAYEEARKLHAEIVKGADPAVTKAEQRRPEPTVASVLDAFIEDHAKPELAEKTATEYGRIVEKILKPRLGHIKIKDLTPTDVASMRDGMRQTSVQAAAAVRVLSSAMSWAVEAGLRPHGANPAAIRLKASRSRERLFSENEVGRMRHAIDKLEGEGEVTKGIALAIKLLFATGCRGGEICGLLWSGVDFEEGLLSWPNSKTGFLEKPMTKEAQKLLRQADRIVGSEFVFPSAVNKAMRIETLADGFERVMKEAGVVPGENATLHLIRHWFATKTYTDKSIALPTQMAIVGHTSVATAMRYSHVSREEMKEAAERASRSRATKVRAAERRGKVIQIRGAAK